MQNQIPGEQPKEPPDPVVNANASPESHASGIADILASMGQMRSKARSRLLANRGRVLKALKRLHATSVVVSFSGSGDSGQIDQVSIYQDKTELKPTKKISILIATSKWNQESGWIERVLSKPMPLADALEALVYDWIESEHAGWENNDGASGECTIEVAEDKFLLNHTTYYTESESMEHSL